MTPQQQKAKELVEKFSTKEDALKACDEIMGSDPLNPSKFNTKVSKAEAYKQSEVEAYHFWQSVKQEITKLT